MNTEQVPKSDILIYQQTNGNIKINNEGELIEEQVIQIQTIKKAGCYIRGERSATTQL